MIPSQTSVERPTLVAPVIDCEPPPNGVATCPPPTPLALRRNTSRPPSRPTGGPCPVRPTVFAAVRDAPPPRAAVVFADAALRRVLEVIDRRRPVAQLRPLLAPTLTDTVIALTRCPRPEAPARAEGGRAAAILRRIRLRMVDADCFGAAREPEAAEVFGTYTRGPRVRALAARIALDGDRWRIVALQIG